MTYPTENMWIFNESLMFLSEIIASSTGAEHLKYFLAQQQQQN